MSYPILFGNTASAGSGPLGSESNPATSGIQLYNAGFPSGTYWLNPTGNNKFQAYVINNRDGGGWVKFLQYYNSTNLGGTAAVNENGSWTTNEIGLAAGKLSHADINALITGNSFLFRVTGGSDNLLNNRVGTGKFEYTQTLPQWGSLTDPSANYTWRVDTNSNGNYSFFCTYTNDTRGLCGHGSSQWQWISDHNYTNVSSNFPAGLGSPICWGFYPEYMGTNLHFMSGIANNQSGGELYWGSNTFGGGAITAASIFVK